MLFVVIDRLQMLDNSSNRKQIQELVDALRSEGSASREGPAGHEGSVGNEENYRKENNDNKRDKDPDRLIKTLFTTDGFTDALIHPPGDERLNSTDFTNGEGAGPEIDGIEVGFL